MVAAPVVSNTAVLVVSVELQVPMQTNSLHEEVPAEDQSSQSILATEAPTDGSRRPFK